MRPPLAASCAVLRQPTRAAASLLLAGLVLLGSACGAAPPPTRIALGHGLAPGHPVHRAMLAMAEQLEERSGGSLAIDIYPSEQLGSERECLELLQIGSLGMTKVSAAVMENFAPGFQVLSAPYLFRDRRHRFAVFDGPVGRELLLSAEPFRLRGLAFYDAGSRSFYTRDRPVRRPEDLRGLKIRTQESPTAIALVQALGGSPTPIAWGELYTALQQGIVDGAENNPPSFHLSGHYEVARFYSLDEHTSVPDVLLVGTALWQRLRPEQRAWLQQAADDSARLQRRLWLEAEEQALAAVAQAGVEVLRPDATAFASRAARVREELRRDPSLAVLLERIESEGQGQKGVAP